MALQNKTVRRFPISKEKMATLIKTHFSTSSEFYYNGKWMYRVTDFKQPVTFVNPKRLVRKSKDSSNVYYCLMDILPSWADFPKRSTSIIFSNHNRDLDAYGDNLYSVFPKNRSRIAFGEYGKNESFIKTPGIEKRLGSSYYSVNLFSEKLSRIFDAISFSMEDGTQFYNITISEFKSFLSKLQKENVVDLMEKALENSPRIEGPLFIDMISHLKKNRDIVKYFDDLFEPESNHISWKYLEDCRDLLGDYKTQLEMWTDSVCMMKNEGHL